MAKDRTPGNRGTGGTARGGSTAAGKSRTRPPTQVVAAPRRPWGLIAAAVAVVLFAVAAIGYAVIKVQEATADEIESPDELGSALQTFDYAAGQEHVTDPVDYTESPPVGGPHDPSWADCTGTVYDVDIRHENAVHAMEHGAVWITYNPDQVTGGDVDTLAKLADTSGRLLSPYAGLDSPVSIQSWNHQLKVDSVDDKRLAQFADFFTRNGEYYPEVGASCENAAFIASPPLAGDPSQSTGTDVPTDAPSSDTAGSSESPAESPAAPSSEAAPSS